MLEYFLQWGHIYIIHFGAWVTFSFGASIYKDGIPPISKLPSMLKSAVILATILSIFSSHSHAHYLASIIKK